MPPIPQQPQTPQQVPQQGRARPQSTVRMSPSQARAVVSDEPRQTQTYLLLAGKHIQEDRTQEKVKTTNALGQVIEVYPEKEFYVPIGGQPLAVESETDLVKKHGEGKFAYAAGQMLADRQRIADLEAQLAQAQRQLARQEARANRTPGDPTLENLEHSPAKAPTGQVSTGYQETGGPGTNPLGAETNEESDGDDEEGAEDQPTAASRPASSEAQLNAMTEKQLRDNAAAEKIDLKGARNKAEVVRAIQAHYAK